MPSRKQAFTSGCTGSNWDMRRYAPLARTIARRGLRDLHDLVTEPKKSDTPAYKQRHRPWPTKKLLALLFLFGALLDLGTVQALTRA